MNDAAPRKSWGAGRVAFMARLDTIRSEITQGVPLTGIYEQHRAALGIGYPSFVKLVGRYADDVRLTRRRPRSAGDEPRSAPFAAQASPASGPAPAPKPVPAKPEGSAADARHEPVARPFHHSPVPKEGELDQLLGPSFAKRRK